MNVDKYEVEYENGFKQVKYVISNEDYDTIKLTLNEIEDLKDAKKDYKHLSKRVETEIGLFDYHYHLLPQRGDFYEAILTGILSPRFDGDKYHTIKSKKI